MLGDSKIWLYRRRYVDLCYTIRNPLHLLFVCSYLTYTLLFDLTIGGSPPTQSPDAPSPVASPTTESPVASPSTSSPVSVPTTSSPVSSPVNDDEDDNPEEDDDPEEAECVDSPLDFMVWGKVRTCNWAGNGNSAKRCAKPGVAKHCPATCGKCDELKCADSGRRFILEENGKKKRCGFFANNPSRCDRFDSAIETCRESCSYCG